MEMLELIMSGFNDEMEKCADFISPQTFKKLSDYDKQRLADSRDAIAHATNPKNKMAHRIREKMVEAAFESAKSVSYDLARTANKDDDNTRAQPVESEPKKKKITRL